MQHFVKPEQYFAAANGIGGFSSLFSEVFSAIAYKRIYIIKGGPGSGKSTFLHRLANACTRRGIRTEKILCSSDPDSLDGLVLPEQKIALLDGTAPHAAEPRLPGATETILNFFDFYDCDSLREHKEELLTLSEEKVYMYQSAYRLLHALGPLHAQLDCTLTECFDFSKARGAVFRMLQRISPQTMRGGTIYLNANSTKGAVFLESGAEPLVRVAPLCGAEWLLLALFCDALSAAGVSALRVADALYEKKTRALLFANGSIEIGTKRENAPYMNTARFLKGGITPAALCRKTHALHDICDSILQEAFSYLAKAGEAHAKIEALCHPYINFDALNDFSARFLRETLLPQCGKQE